MFCPVTEFVAGYVELPIRRNQPDLHKQVTLRQATLMIR